tara:strand:- start:89 stop:742 length:654 start_codon:yes stop_codon:yes gene_type:complete
MTYQPKSKIKHQETSGNEFVNRNTKEYYIGPYIETSEGKYYAGKSIVNLGVELVKPFSTANNFGGGEDFDRYLRLKKEPYSILSITKEIPTIKLPPTEEDYNNGFYIRYFKKRINNDFDYCEIDKDTFKVLGEKSPSFDYRLYKIGQIKWFITGNNVENLNKLNIEKLSRYFPNLNTLFSVPNEFQKTNEIIKQPTQTFTYNYPTNGGSSGGGGGGY